MKKGPNFLSSSFINCTGLFNISFNGSPIPEIDSFKIWNEDKSDKRMDIIGQNGNEGLHYEDDIKTPKPGPTGQVIT